MLFFSLKLCLKPGQPIILLYNWRGKEPKSVPFAGSPDAGRSTEYPSSTYSQAQPVTGGSELERGPNLGGHSGLGIGWKGLAHVN